MPEWVLFPVSGFVEWSEVHFGGKCALIDLISSIGKVSAVLYVSRSKVQVQKLPMSMVE